MAEQLLTCPLCGAPAALASDDGGERWHGVECTECSAAALNATEWNRRAAPEPPPEAFAQARLEGFNEAVEACAQLVESGYGVQHPLKPLGVFSTYVAGDSRSAASLRALKRASP